MEVKKVLLIFFERRARRPPLDFSGRPRIPLLSTFNGILSSGQSAVVGRVVIKTTQSTSFFEKALNAVGLIEI